MIDPKSVLHLKQTLMITSWKTLNRFEKTTLSCLNLLKFIQTYSAEGQYTFTAQDAGVYLNAEVKMV